MPTPEEPLFNLIDEPWIPVLTTHGQCRQVGVRDAFRRAGEFTQLVGEVPTQAFAITRVLLAILHSGGPDVVSAGSWRALRDQWPTAVDMVESYLDEWRDRFWLFHPIHPFFQVADLHTARQDCSSLSKVIADVPNGRPLFTTRIGKGLHDIDFAEAARWLIHAQAFDPSGIRSGAVGDRRVKGGKGYPIGPGWAAQISGTWLSGVTVKDTLLLNRVALSASLSGLRETPPDLPAWERRAATAEESDLVGRPSGPVDLYTWQARRVRLHRLGDRVTGLVLAQGDPMAPQNRHFVEPMTPWRFSEPQTKKFGATTYMPVMNDPDRLFWRGLSTLLPQQEEHVDREGIAAGLSPGVLRWIAHLRHENVLTDDLVTVRSTWMALGSNNSVIDEIADDHLAIPSVLVADLSQRLRQVALDGVTAAEGAVAGYVQLAANLAAAAGQTDRELDGPRSRARMDGYAALDGPFRDWLAGLMEEELASQAEGRWQSQVREIVWALASRALEEAGPAAWVGRQVGSRHVDLGQAEAWYRAALFKALPRSGARREEPVTP